MKSAISSALACALLSGAVSAQFPGVPPLPEMKAPSGASIMSSSGYGLRVAAEHAKLELPSTGLSYRLNTAMGTEALAGHYSGQLIALGWKQSARFMDARLGVVRFIAGSEADPMTGILTVLPFPEAGNAVVAIRLVRSKAPWTQRSRAGGAGASAAAPRATPTVTFEPLSPVMNLPASVQWVENRGGGGSDDHYRSDVRLETTLPTSALMTAMLKQVSGPEWAEDVRLGDAMQTVVRRTRLPGRLRSEVWMLTSMPGINQVDAVVSSTCSSRPGPPPRNAAGQPTRMHGSIPCDEAR